MTTLLFWISSLLVAAISSWIIVWYSQRRFTKLHPYARPPSLQLLDDNSLFFAHNFCTIPFRDGATLSATRYENRLLFYENQTRFNCGACQTPLGDLPDLIRNYVVLYNSQTKKRQIVDIPRIKQMHQQASTMIQAEDPRLFWDDISARLYMTATVLTQTSVKIGLFEIDPQTLRCIGGKILGRKSQMGKELWSQPQKNWVLFQDGNGDTCVLTHAHPSWQVWRVDLPSARMFRKTIVDSTGFFSSITGGNLGNGVPLLVRCSSPPMRMSSNTMVCALHTREDTESRAPLYRTIFVEFSDQPPYQLVRHSQVMGYTNDTARVEFAAGFYPDNPTCPQTTRWNLCLGLDDKTNILVVTNLREIFDK